MHDDSKKPDAAQPVAWRYWNEKSKSWNTTTSTVVADVMRESGRAVESLFAAPQASEAVRDSLMAFDEAMKLCDDFPELQHHRDALLFAVQKARAALSAQPGAQKEQSDAG